MWTAALEEKRQAFHSFYAEFAKDLERPTVCASLSFYLSLALSPFSSPSLSPFRPLSFSYLRMRTNQAFPKDVSVSEWRVRQRREEVAAAERAKELEWDRERATFHECVERLQVQLHAGTNPSPTPAVPPPPPPRRDKARSSNATTVADLEPKGGSGLDEVLTHTLSASVPLCDADRQACWNYALNRFHPCRVCASFLSP